MRDSREGPSRRSFLQQIGLGAAGLGIVGLWDPTDVFGDPHAGHEMQGGSCAPPPHGAPVPFRRDCRPIRPRQVANRLTAGEVDQLKAAYAAMRALDASDPTDPRGFTQQANIHCFHCAGTPANQRHGTWQFLAWHRAYLYFHERILGKLVNDSNFRLPFWGWDMAEYRTLPRPYVTPNDATNPLFNPTRELAPGTALDPAVINDDVIADTLIIAATEDFLGTAASPGIPENNPHGPPHYLTGGDTGDMSFFASAARDPVFYTHHATLDKVWSDWIKADSAHANPTDAAYRDLTFTFFDENKVWRSIKASQMLDHEVSLRYVYEAQRWWSPLVCLRWRPIRAEFAPTRSMILNNAPLARALRGDAPVRLTLRGLQVPVDRSAIYRIYANAAAARENRGPESAGFLGFVTVVLNSKENNPPTRGTRNVSVTLRPGVRAALAAGTPLQPVLVEHGRRGPGAANVRTIPSRVAGVSFAIGEPDEEK